MAAVRDGSLTRCRRVSQLGDGLQVVCRSCQVRFLALNTGAKARRARASVCTYLENCQAKVCRLPKPTIDLSVVINYNCRIRAASSRARERVRQGETKTNSYSENARNSQCIQSTGDTFLLKQFFFLNFAHHCKVHCA